MIRSKACSKCGEMKPLDGFPPDGRVLDGRQSKCRPCIAVEMRAHRIANSERVHEQDRARYAASPDKFRERRKGYREANPEEVAIQKLRSTHGLSDSRIVELRGGSCEICGLPPGASERTHDIDHDHTMTGPESVRGTLCNGCNLSLGFFEKQRDPKCRPGDTDNPLWRASARKYLDDFNAQLTEATA